MDRPDVADLLAKEITEEYYSEKNWLISGPRLRARIAVAIRESRHLVPSPPAPPRSEGERCVCGRLVADLPRMMLDGTPYCDHDPNTIPPRSEGNVANSRAVSKPLVDEWLADGPGTYTNLEGRIMEALEGAARDAAKEMQERCAKVAEKTKVDPYDFSKDVRPAVKTFRHIIAAAIRALPPEEGK